MKLQSVGVFVVNSREVVSPCYCSQRRVHLNMQPDRLLASLCTCYTLVIHIQLAWHNVGIQNCGTQCCITFRRRRQSIGRVNEK